MNLTCLNPTRGWACVLLMLICVGGWGCHSPKEASSSAFAAVTIKERSMVDIRRVTKEVFEKHGYAKTDETVSPDFTFEKLGTTMNTVVYGGWIGKVWVRVKVYIDPQSGTEFLLRCEAFMVGDHGDTFMEEEHRLTRMKRGPYLELLQEIKMELGLPVEK